MLTGKQEKFVRNLIQGMSQREAYKNSYNAENMTDKSIDEEACRLFNDPKISSRYQELIERAATASVMTAQERLEYLTAIIYGVEQELIRGTVEGEVVEFERPADLNTRMKAIDIMNKMQGEYVTRISGEVSVKLEDLL
jgi:phage terminase small subunit